MSRAKRLEAVEEAVRPQIEQVVHLYISDGNPEPPKAWSSRVTATRDAKGRQIIMHHPTRDTPETVT